MDFTLGALRHFRSISGVSGRLCQEERKDIVQPVPLRKAIAHYTASPCQV